MKTNKRNAVNIVGKISGPKYCPTSLQVKESIQLANGGANLDIPTEQDVSLKEDDTKHSSEKTETSMELPQSRAKGTKLTTG